MQDAPFGLLRGQLFGHGLGTGHLFLGNQDIFRRNVFSQPGVLAIFFHFFRHTVTMEAPGSETTPLLSHPPASAESLGVSPPVRLENLPPAVEHYAGAPLPRKLNPGSSNHQYPQKNPSLDIGLTMLYEWCIITYIHRYIHIY
jgi:hypothetical protein